MRNEVHMPMMDGHGPRMHTVAATNDSDMSDGDPLEPHQWMMPPSNARAMHTRVGTQYQATIPTLVADSASEESDHAGHLIDSTPDMSPSESPRANNNLAGLAGLLAAAAEQNENTSSNGSTPPDRSPESNRTASNRSSLGKRASGLLPSSLAEDQQRGPKLRRTDSTSSDS
eukprot:272218_1